MAVTGAAMKNCSNETNALKAFFFRSEGSAVLNLTSHSFTA